MVDYNKLCQMVSGGAKFKIDFAKREAKVGKTVVFAKDVDNYEWVNKGVPTLAMFVEIVEDLYEKYKHSIPSERSECGAKRYFRALHEEELEDDDMLYGMPRELARFQLEFEIVKYLVKGFQWDEAQMGKWFWQSKKDKDLVILRQWFENK